MDNLFIMDKKLMAAVIRSLKTLDVRGWDSYDTLVGVVNLLEKGMNGPDKKPEEESESET